MQIAVRLFIPLAAVVLLAGCDFRDKIPLTPKDAIRAADTFGTAAREKVEETGEGTVFRVSIEARRAASWNRALISMRRSLKSDCPDGQAAKELGTQPELDRSSMDSGTHEHAEGTVFVRTILCPHEPAFAFELGRSISLEDGQRLMYERLEEIPRTDASMAMVLPLTPHEYLPLYQQIENTLGIFIFGSVARCPDGVVLRDVMLGKVQDPGTHDGVEDPEAYLGFIVDCVGSKPLVIPKQPG